MPDRILVFDMDGVLVDVNESYRATILRTIQHFTGELLSNEVIQEYKNAGGWNSDWDLAHHLITQRGFEVSFRDVVAYFNGVFFGTAQDGLIYRERWIAGDGLLDELARTWQFALFTGRIREELQVTLARFASHLNFDPIMSADVLTEQKPAPEGLLRIAALNPGKELWYIGDTVDDARAARAAGVPFIGIAALDSPGRSDLLGLFRSEKAAAIIEDINQLRTVLPQ
jgi:HAD superfamily hydrolase (TIGR01548 family)